MSTLSNYVNRISPLERIDLGNFQHRLSEIESEGTFDTLQVYSCYSQIYKGEFEILGRKSSPLTDQLAAKALH